MTTDKKNIINNFFYKNSKYLIIFFVFLTFLFIIKIYKHFYSTTNLTLNIKNAIFVGNGVAINKEYIITSRSLVQKYCHGTLSGVQAPVYVIDEDMTYPARILMEDPILDIVLLRLKSDTLKSHSYIRIDQGNYNFNSKYIIPTTKNKSATFNFKPIRLFKTKNKNIYISIRNFFLNESIIGSPIFNKNFVLQGIVKNIDKNYYDSNKKDYFFNAIGFQKFYSIITSDMIKEFLDKYDIDYSQVGNNIDMDNNTYNAKKSILNIVCLKVY